MANLLKYRPIFITYDTAQQIPTECNSITLLNLGTSIAYVENVPIQPNQSLAIDGNECEYTDVNLSLRFENTPGLQNTLIAIKKVYA